MIHGHGDEEQQELCVQSRQRLERKGKVDTAVSSKSCRSMPYYYLNFIRLSLSLVFRQGI